MSMKHCLQLKAEKLQRKLEYYLRLFLHDNRQTTEHVVYPTLNHRGVLSETYDLVIPKTMSSVAPRPDFGRVRRNPNFARIHTAALASAAKYQILGNVAGV